MSQAHVGYATMLEQFDPVEATRLTALAEQAGFRGAMVADHFQPWVPAAGQRLVRLDMLAAIGERTTARMGPGVTCPSFRFHPAMLAQASATLAAMYPVGSSSASARARRSTNTLSATTGRRRRPRCRACGRPSRSSRSSSPARTSSTRASSSQLETARLWSHAGVAAADLHCHLGTGHREAHRAHADGIITAGATLEKIGEPVRSLRAGATEAGAKPGTHVKILQLHLSWAPDRRGGNRATRCASGPTAA